MGGLLQEPPAAAHGQAALRWLWGGEWERLAKGCVCPGLTAEVALLVVCPHQNLSGYLCSGRTLPSASRQMHSDPGSPWLWHTGKNALADK